MTLHYTIPLPPITKKNHQQILTNHRTGKPFIAQSNTYKRYAKDCAWFLRPVPKAPISVPVEVVELFYMPTRRKVDLTNLQAAADDILVENKIIADDNSQIIVSHDGSRVLYDKDRPRTEITITEVDHGF